MKRPAVPRSAAMPRPALRAAAALLLAAFLAAQSAACAATCLLQGHRHPGVIGMQGHGHVMTCHTDLSVRAELPPSLGEMLPVAAPAPVPAVAVTTDRPAEPAVSPTQHVPTTDPPPPRPA
jgi:hypothetical protein